MACYYNGNFSQLSVGSRKRNSILWYDNNFIGTELDPELSYAKIAEACGFQGVTVNTQTEINGNNQRCMQCTK